MVRGCGEGGREGGRVGGRDDDEGKEVWVNPNTIGGERKEVEIWNEIRQPIAENQKAKGLIC